MNREILFRGKIDYPDSANEKLIARNGNWEYGYLYRSTNGKYYIKPLERYLSLPIITETIGQYTGLTDKEGNKIFEGDIVKAKRLDRDDEIAVVLSVTNIYGNSFQLDPLKNWEYTSWDEITVIGNIHDNKDLIESSVDNE